MKTHAFIYVGGREREREERPVGCAVQQALTPEAAAVVKQAVVLAKRRGHAQVTPLHVANTMLAAGGGGGLLRAACLQSQSHSHPLQCKALELCFNVALNRLPASASSHPISGHHHSHYPTISNALVAAFKRAQAHHRRGAAATDNQQPPPPILTMKIELEQLVVSILDDPSVSRVMREAGFSSTQVKINVEKATSLELSPSKQNDDEVVVINLDHSSSSNDGGDVDDDSSIIMEALVASKRRRSLAVVGESISNVEAAVKEVVDRVERGGGGVPEALRDVRFLTLPPFYSFCNVGREVVQQKMEELRFVVRSLVGKGVVLYVGDLGWISEYRVSLERERRYYCSVEHVIMEVGRLVSEISVDGGEMGRFWLMGIANFQTYMRCRNGYNSLEMIWRLHPLTIPANSLGLSLLSQSDNEHGSSKCGKLQSLPSWLKLDETRPLNDQQTQNLSLNSSSSSDAAAAAPQKLKEFNAGNLNTLCNLLEEKVPWQKEIIPEISGTILQCRSGMLRRPDADKGNLKEETWLFFLGPDARAKEEIATNLASIVFGSNIVLIEKEDGVGSSSSYVERFVREVSENPHRVFLLKDLERVDCWSRMRIKRAIERGRICDEINGEEFCLFDAIVILSCDKFSSTSSSENAGGGGGGGGGGEGRSGGVSLDLNMSFGDENLQSLDGLGILENVDRLVVFKMHDL